MMKTGLRLKKKERKNENIQKERSRWKERKKE